MNKKQKLLFLLLSHHGSEKLHRTIHVRLWGKDLYFCARGVGRYSGLLSAVTASYLLTFPSWFYSLIFVFFPLPSIVDWITQKLGSRESRNWIRVTTGYLLGIAQGYLLISLVKGMTQLSVFGITVLVLYLFSVCFLVKGSKGDRNERGG